LIKPPEGGFFMPKTAAPVPSGVKRRDNQARTYRVKNEGIEFTMNKEKLKEFGLTDEQADKVIGALDNAFVPKSRFDEVNTEKNQLKASLKERDEQLETLRTESGAAEKLKAQIADLQTANAAKEKEHAAEMKRVKREALDERLLTEAKAINPIAVKPFLTPIDEGVDDEGYAALRKQHIEALTKTDSTKFLFQTESAQTFVGVKPGETGVPATQTTSGNNPFDPKSYDEAAQIKMFRDNPELGKAMAKQAGVKMY
jgi:hypothetical protein